MHGISMIRKVQYLIWAECVGHEEEMATNLGGEENESDSNDGRDNELASDVKFDGSKFGEDGNHWLQEAND